uniref:Uncharacterized protein n=1 Tax=Candidatus Kentrum sp. TC TaxID=2126339 RepID=A0A450Y7Y9_9GAMM|nr:MAG: hypothetical protein BECKTC1821E_GA0114239_100145 [Candidatus Kentron sp. TC]
MGITKTFLDNEPHSMENISVLHARIQTGCSLRGQRFFRDFYFSDALKKTHFFYSPSVSPTSDNGTLFFPATAIRKMRYQLFISLGSTRSMRSVLWRTASMALISAGERNASDRFSHRDSRNVDHLGIVREIGVRAANGEFHNRNPSHGCSL